MIFTRQFFEVTLALIAIFAALIWMMSAKIREYKKIKSAADQETAKLKNVADDIQVKQSILLSRNSELEVITNRIMELSRQANQLADIKKQLSEQNENEKKSLDSFKQYIDSCKQKYQQTLDTHMKEIQADYDYEAALIDSNIASKQQELNGLVSTIKAVNEAQIRQKTIAEQQNQNHKIVINDKMAQHDLKCLRKCRDGLYNQVSLNKALWNVYYKDAAAGLCERILDKEHNCGIYKITNILTSQSYIGQSLNLDRRIKQHMRNMVYLDQKTVTPLYQAGIKYGLQNFTFEILETCLPQYLDEKEKFYIDLYSSYELGYNSTRGNN